MNKKLIFLLLIITIFIGIFFRFYNLNWGAPFYFHPDERNIASSVSQLKFPNQLHPHFFAYGSIPIYTVFTTGLFYNFSTSCKFSPSNCTVSFEQAIILGRILSSLLSIAIIPLIYLTGVKLKNKTVGILASILALLSVGLIQFSHFSTFEMWLTFFSLLLFYFCLTFMESAKIKTSVLVGLTLGILIGIKVSSLVLFVLPIIALSLSKRAGNIKHIAFLSFSFLLICVVAITFFALTNPFSLLDFKSFNSTFEYESSVALGTLPVFYTGEFYNTIPVLFHFHKIYPFILSPLLTILFIPSFLYIFFLGLKTKNKSYLLLTTYYLLLFLSQTLLFAKWTRYVIPTLPFIYLIIALSIVKFFERKKSIHYYTSILVIIISSLIFSVSYFKTTFIDLDSRVVASLWARKNIPPSSKITSEVYDLGIIPFNSYFSNIVLFNFYELDNKSLESNEQSLSKMLQNSEYIILPSQRLVHTRIANPQKFPKGNAFYRNLLSGSLGFTQVYKTPCDIFCKITYMGNPEKNFEQTSSVFDRPSVYIFKK